jgi:hypothetical protein
VRERGKKKRWIVVEVGQVILLNPYSYPAEWFCRFLVRKLRIRKVK